MSSKIERFTPRARWSLSLAQAACEHFQNGLIEPEHILLGLYDERDGYAGQVLRELGMTRQMIVNVLDLQLQKQPEFATTLLSTATKKSLERAVDEARRGSFSTIGTGCLLLGILRLNRPLTHTILLQNNLSSNEVMVKLSDAFSAKQIFNDEIISTNTHLPLDFMSFVSQFFNRSERQSPPPSPQSNEDLEVYRRSVVEVLTDAFAIYPGNVHIMNSLIRYQILLKDYRGLIATLDHVRASEKLEYNVPRLRVTAIFLTGDYDKTIAECNLHLEKNPEDALLYYLRGSAYRELKERTKAVADLKKALEFWDMIDLLTDADARKQQVMEYIAEDEESKPE